jgi:hypothetical protein
MLCSVAQLYIRTLRLPVLLLNLDPLTGIGVKTREHEPHIGHLIWIDVHVLCVGLDGWGPRRII